MREKPIKRPSDFTSMAGFAAKWNIDVGHLSRYMDGYRQQAQGEPIREDVIHSAIMIHIWVGERWIEFNDDAEAFTRWPKKDFSFSCSVCGRSTDSAPCQPMPTFCEVHCPDHTYVYSQSERRHYCFICDADRPIDWGDDE